ncbi:hypothetical protein L218DRAFT_959270 [Marasmius fiardii PR-910]|nr:hypothetical protein L218DRAFT_959270 [Marasmius fiardii PR-910]
MSSLTPPLGNLPGLYWDPERKRYFPLPAQSSNTSTSPSLLTPRPVIHKRKKRNWTTNTVHITSSTKAGRTPEASLSTEKRHSCHESGDSDLQLQSDLEAGVSVHSSDHTRKPRRNWKSSYNTVCFGSGLLVSCYSERERARSELIKAWLSNSQSQWKPTQAPLIIGNTITALDFSSTGRHQRRFVGDSLGWLYTYIRLESPRSLLHGEEEDEDAERGWKNWTEELQVNLHPGGEVSSIHTSQTRCIATCFGPTTRICVQRFDKDDLPQTTLLTLPSHIYDVRSSCLAQGSETNSQGIILGAAKKAVYMPDLEYSSQREMRMLETNSDVFCVATTPKTRGNIAFAGCRNGGIKQFDLRSSSSSNVIKLKRQSSVIYMNTIERFPNEMVVGWMNGELAAYDVRFLSSTETPSPIRTFNGHIGGRNTHQHWGSVSILLRPSS